MTAAPKSLNTYESDERSALREDKADLGFDLVSTAAIFAELPEPKYLVTSVVRRGAVLLIGGYGSSWKTWLACDMSLGVAAGGQWLGHFDCERGRATILDWESGSYELRRRLQRLARGRAETVTGGIDFATMPGCYMGTERFKQAMTKLAAQRDLVVIDSLRAATPHAEENDSAIRAGLDQLRAIAERTGCSFVVIVHARKSSQGAGRPDPREILRGSSAIFDAADAVLIVTASEKSDPLRVEQTKARHGRAVEPFGVEIEDTPLGTGIILRVVDVDAAPAPTPDAKFLAAVDKVFAVVKTNPGISSRQLRERSGVMARTTDAAVEHLLEGKRIVNVGDKARASYRPNGAHT